MNILEVVLIVLLFAYTIYLNEFKKKEESSDFASGETYANVKEYPYMGKNLLTKEEYKFFYVLKEFCQKNSLMLCPKVHMEDFLSVTHNMNHAKYRGYIKAKHVDFMICNRDLHILCCIELDGRIHEREKVKKADRFINGVFEQTGIPLFRIKTTSDYKEELDKIYTKIIK